MKKIENSVNTQNKRAKKHHNVFKYLAGMGFSMFLSLIMIFILQEKSKSEAPNRANEVNHEVIQTKEIQTNSHEPKLLFLGVDAATWKFINPLMAEGKLPNFKFLVENGVRATPPTLNPTISPAIWTTVATGVLPEKHGINNFISISEDSYEQQLVKSTDRRVKALWNILSDAGLKVGVFSYWATWPPEEINGYNVTERALFEETSGAYPESLRPLITINSGKILGLKAITQGLKIAFPTPTGPNDANFFALAHQQMERLRDLFIGNSLFLYKKELPDALIQISGVIDATQHLFLKFSWPDEYPHEINPDLLKKYKNFIESLYIAHDKMIGDYLKLAGPNTHIIVMSDHGVFIDPAVGYRVHNFNGILERLGFLKYNQQGQIDFGKTVAFECNNNTFDWQRRICINLEGKFANGIVPQKEFELRRNEVISKLNTIKTHSGESPFISLAKSQKEEADIEYDLRRDLLEEIIKIGGEFVPFRDYTKWTIESGNHYSDPLGPDGIFIWYGPGIKKNYEISTLDLVDVFPNLLHVLGLPIPEDIDGVYLQELYERPQAPQYVDSYEEASNRIYSGSHELIDDRDNFTISGSEVYIHSDIPANDPFDQFCFDYPSKLDFLLKIVNLEQSTNLNLNYTPWDHPIINKKTDLLREILVSELPDSKTFVYQPEDITFESNAESDKVYRINIPLDLKEPHSVGIWTNTSFYVKAPFAGMMQVVAKGQPAGKKYPIIEVLQKNKVLGQIEVNSTDYKIYTFPIQERGLVTLRFINDELINNEDRNLYLQRIKFLPEETEVKNEQAYFFRENDQICFYNKARGTTEVHFQMLPKALNEESSSAERVILDLLQNTGEIKP